MFASKQRGTVIAKGLKIVGSATAEGLVELNGQVEGEIHCTSPLVSRARSRDWCTCRACARGSPRHTCILCTGVLVVIGHLSHAKHTKGRRPKPTPYTIHPNSLLLPGLSNHLVILGRCAGTGR
jgi:hypothetical protein